MSIPGIGECTALRGIFTVLIAFSYSKNCLLS